MVETVVVGNEDFKEGLTAESNTMAANKVREALPTEWAKFKRTVFMSCVFSIFNFYLYICTICILFYSAGPLASREIHCSISTSGVRWLSG